MPQLYDQPQAKPPKPESTGAPAAVRDPASAALDTHPVHPTYAGRLEPNVTWTPKQVQRAYGKGTVLVSSKRAINQRHVETAIARWNSAAGAPIFKYVPSIFMADVVIQMKKDPGGYEAMGGPSVAQGGVGFGVVVPPHDPGYGQGPTDRPGLLEHELGHTIGLGHPYDEGSPTIGYGGTSSVEQQALIATYSQPWNSNYATTPGSHRIMSTNVGNVSIAEGYAALEQLGFDQAWLELYRAVQARLGMVGA